MRPISSSDVIGLFDAVPLDDLPLFRRRMALVEELGLDEASIVAEVGTLQVMRLCFAGRRFDLEIRGVDPEPAALIGVLDDDGETIVDLVAWPLERPAAMATYAGHAVMLGEEQAWAHPATAMSPPLRVHRTALAWLRAGCRGVVPIDLQRSAHVFLKIGGELLAEDDAHGAALDAARRAVIGRACRIMVQVPLKEAA